MPAKFLSSIFSGHYAGGKNKEGEKEFFTVCDSGVGHFVLPEIWNFFYIYPGPEKRREISSKLAEAIYYFDPYDYQSRGYYYEQGGQLTEACEQYILAFNKLYFENLANKETELAGKIFSICKECGFFDYWNVLLRIYEAMEALNYDLCIQCIETMPHPPTLRLLILKEYLEGLCLHRLGRTYEEQISSMTTMETVAKHAKGLEDGIWCDCQAVLLSLYMNINGDIVAARQVMQELTFFYTQKSMAPFAQKGLHAMERKWAALYSVERAVIKTECSVQYFQNGQYPAQYLMALNNHAANLIVLGQYSKALEYLDQAMDLLARFPSIRVNTAYSLNNYCVAAVLSKRISAADAHNTLKTAIGSSAFGDWMYILRLNDCIFMAQTGNLEDAETGLQELLRKGQDLNDDYYVFYASANLASVYFLQGRPAESIHILKTNCQKAPALFKETEKVYLQERTVQWIKAAESIGLPDPSTFETLLLELHPEETQWNFVGRGFLYSDIQFWSEP